MMSHNKGQPCDENEHRSTGVRGLSVCMTGTSAVFHCFCYQLAYKKFDLFISGFSLTEQKVHNFFFFFFCSVETCLYECLLKRRERKKKNHQARD